MKLRSSLSLVSAAVLALAAGAAHAESTYGYNPAGGGTVTATAKVDIKIVVPKVVVLMVGTGGGTVDKLNFNGQVSIPSTPTLVTGDATVSTSTDSAALTWNGVAPTFSFPTNTAGTAAYAWTNGSAVKVNCAASAIGAGGPALTNITAAAGSGDNFVHPTGTLAACTATPNLTAGTMYIGYWTYTLDTTGASSWKPGTYSTTVTYTATGT